MSGERSGHRMTPAALVEAFRAALTGLDGVLHEEPDLDAARHRARDLIDGATVARWPDAALDSIADGAQAPAAQAGVSLILADVAVAETGQIGFVHRDGRARGDALLPDRQIALLAADDLVESVADAFAHLGFGGPHHPGNVVFAAGPSRTADIEQRIILGVHAPRSLDVVLYGPQA